MGKTERKWSLHTMARIESGNALVMSIVMLSLLTILGTGGLITANIETKISENYTKSIKSFYASVSGIEEAKARLKGLPAAANYVGDPAATPNATWSAYLLTDTSMWTTASDGDYNATLTNYFPTSVSHTATTESANSLQTTNTYWVKLWYKREYDAELAGHTTLAPLYADGDGDTTTHTAASPGNVVYYGYTSTTSVTPEEYTIAGTSSPTGTPAVLIKAYGYDGSATNSQTILETTLLRRPGPAVGQALFGDEIESSGNAVSLNGIDNCDPTTSVPYLGWDGTDSPDMSGNAAGTLTTNSTPQELDYAGDLPVGEWVAELSPYATIVEPTQADIDDSYGSSSYYEVVYVDSTVGMAGGFTSSEAAFSNLVGYGTLIIKGNAKFNGTLLWYGLILATGDITMVGGGPVAAKTVYGAVLADGEADINGTANIQYDSCEIAKAKGGYPYFYAGWKDTSL